MPEAEISDAEIEMAQVFYDRRRAKADLFPEERFNKPIWDMLLFLFIHHRREVPTGELCDANRVLRATGSRYLRQLESMALIARSSSDGDGRVQIVRLSDEGTSAMRLYLAAPTYSVHVGHLG